MDPDLIIVIAIIVIAVALALGLKVLIVWFAKKGFDKFSRKNKKSKNK